MANIQVVCRKCKETQCVIKTVRIRRVFNGFIVSLHVEGKFFTQRIERQNLTLRTCLKRLARRTIFYSRSQELYDKVIGEFVAREHYQPV